MKKIISALMMAVCIGMAMPAQAQLIKFGVKGGVNLAKADFNKSDLKIFENYILDGGVFGYTNRNVDAINGANNSTTFIGGLKSILERVFPSYDKLKERYAWFGSPPKMLLPLGWVRFWLYRLKYGKIGDIKRIGKIVEVSDDVVIHNSLMENLGLKEKRK